MAKSHDDDDNEDDDYDDDGEDDKREREEIWRKPSQKQVRYMEEREKSGNS